MPLKSPEVQQPGKYNLEEYINNQEQITLDKEHRNIAGRKEERKNAREKEAGIQREEGRAGAD